MTTRTAYLVGVLGLLVAALGFARAADIEAKAFDRSVLRVHTGTTDIDVSAADYTSATVLLTVAPPANTGMTDCRVVFDLDKTTTGFNDAQDGTSDTIQFHVARKVDGTNWRPDDAQKTTTITAAAANTRSTSILIGDVGPNESLRIYVTLSVEVADIELPYVFTYKSPDRATFTDVSN